MEAVSSWPKGTIAQGSTLHPPNIVKDKPRSYNDSFAIDGDQVTFWNDNTPRSWPDTLTVTTPSTILLNGIVVLSNSLGWLLDYTVDTPDPDKQWASIARIVNATGPLRIIIFETPANVNKFRISSSGAQLDYSRINEIYPIFAVNVSSATPTNSSSQPVSITVTESGTPPLSTTPSSDNLCSSSCSTSSSGKTSEHAALASSTPTGSATSTENSSKKVAPAAMIASGVFGGLLAILLIALVTLLLIKRKRKAGAAAQEGKDDTGPGNLSNAINAASPMTTCTYNLPYVVSAPVPVAYSASPRRPEIYDISPWTGGEISNGLSASMRAVSTGPPRPGLPQELDSGVPSTELQ